MAKMILVKRDYWAKDNHCPYRNCFHDKEDQPLDWYDVIRELLSDIEDGDEMEIVVTKTGKRPFGDRRYCYQTPHAYAPETDEQMAVRLGKGGGE